VNQAIAAPSQVHCRPKPSPPRHTNPSRWRLERWLQTQAASVSPGSRFLDAGAGDGRYRHFFDHLAYESADFCQVDKAYGHIDYVCDLADIPVPDGTFEAIACTQVLEHVREPQAILREFHRILTSNGKLFLTAPLHYEEHEIPFDYYRYTQYGLRHLMATAGFVVESLEWLEGYYGTLSHQFERAGRYLPKRASDYGGGLRGSCSAVAAKGLRPLLRTLSRYFASLEFRHKHTGTGYCKNYCVVAAKA